jgi:hypothetical protein
MIFVYVCSTWGIVDRKTRFETWITRKDVIGVSLSHLPYLITLKAYLCSQRTPNVQIKYFVWLVDLQIICSKHGLDTWFSPIDDIRKCSFDMKNSWTKTRFETWITRRDVNVVRMFHLSYLIHKCLTCAHKGHQMSKSRILCVIGRSTDYLS